MSLFVLCAWLAIGLALRTSALRDTGRAWRPWALACSLSLALACAAALTGCPLPPSDHCTPMATRCSPQGKPQRCSASQRWWSEPTAQPCSALGAVCCPARSPYGNVVHACVPQAVCLPEPTLADALVLDAVEAVLEGGAR